MTRTATRTTAAIFLTFLCRDPAWAASIFLQCDVINMDEPKQETRELWEIKDASAFLDGHKISDNVTISGSRIEITKEHILANSMLLMRVAIDRSTGEIASAWTDEKGVMKVHRSGTCSEAAAPAGKF